jgi:hypothetical protein
MSWQEDLQQLDAALAGGQISADDYRRRRDEVLAQASGGSAPAPQAPPATPEPAQQPAQQPQYPQPGQPPQGQTAAPQEGSHFPPPFRWESTPPQASPTEATQTIRPVSPPDSDSTQVVSNTQSADRTQVVRDAPRHQGPNSGGFPAQYAQQGGGWQQQPPQQQPDNSAPWAGTEFPPLGGAGNWALKQGPEVFGDSNGSTGKRIAVIAAVIVVLAGLGVGAFFLFNHGGGSTRQQAAPPQVTTTPPKPKDDLEVAKLPGTGQDQSGIASLTDVINNGLLTNDENAAYLTAGATGVRLVTSTLPNGARLWIMTARTASAPAAATAVTKLASLQVRYGMSTYTGTTPPGVQVTEVTPAAGASGTTTIRGHYSHNRTVVRVQVYGPDATTVGKTFDEILAAQLSALPANVS